MPRRAWFRAKRYGWGWHPATWQGWLITLAFILAITLAALALESSPTFLPDFLLAVLIAAVALLAVCWKTGEPPRWR